MVTHGGAFQGEQRLLTVDSTMFIFPALFVAYQLIQVILLALPHTNYTNML